MDQLEIDHGNPTASRNQFEEEGTTFEGTNFQRVSWILGRLLRRKSSMIPWTSTLGSQDQIKRGVHTEVFQRIISPTVKNTYLLPHITELLDKLKGTEYFMKLDVRWGYNNIWIKDGDQWKAAFKMNWGLFKPTVMFFGLCNSPATFQAMMDDIFGDLINDCIIIVYMDDIFIFAKDTFTLTENTKEVLKGLKDNDLFLKLTKCEFNKTKVEYLGMIIEEGKISMDPGKLAGLRNWPAPTSVKQTRKFLGFRNFYWQFIQHFSQIAKLLNDLLKKDQQFDWTIECQQAFKILKKSFMEEPVLMMPDQTKSFQIKIDTLKYATGTVLTQLDSNGDLYSLSFILKTLSPAEWNYKIYDSELLTIIRALEEWRHYIQGSPHTTVVLSDYKNLTYYCKAKKLARRQARSLYLSEFNVNLVHTPGCNPTSHRWMDMILSWSW